MKLLKLSFFFALFITLAACGDDDSSGSCVQADWVGTYDGTANCDGDTDDVVVTITASGTDAVIIKYETDVIEVEFDPITFDGCGVNQSSSAGGSSVTLDVDLNGDNLTLTDEVSSGGYMSSCTITATRN